MRTFRKTPPEKARPRRRLVAALACAAVAVAAVVAVAVPLAASADSPVFVNRLSTGSLQISKSVTGDNPDPDKTYKVHVKLVAPEGSEIPDGEWSVTHPYIVPPFDDSSTDEEIAEAIRRADAGEFDLHDYWHVGDKRTVTMTDGAQYTMVLMDTDAYEKADGSGKASFIWGFEELLTTTHRMNATATNSGGWDATEMRTWLNGDDVYGKLPD